MWDWTQDLSSCPPESLHTGTQVQRLIQGRFDRDRWEGGCFFWGDPHDTVMHLNILFSYKVLGTSLLNSLLSDWTVHELSDGTSASLPTPDWLNWFPSIKITYQCPPSLEKLTCRYRFIWCFLQPFKEIKPRHAGRLYLTISKYAHSVQRVRKPFTSLHVLGYVTIIKLKPT